MSVIEQEISLKLEEQQIRKRVTFVGDRIALVMAVSFGLLIGIFLIFKYINLPIESVGWFYLALVITGGICFIVYVITNEKVYYREHIFANSNYILVQTTWFCFSIPVAGLLSIPFGWQQITDVTITYLLQYSTGYILARILWTKWPVLKKNEKTIIVLLVVFMLIFPSVTIGTLCIINKYLYFGVLLFIYGIGSLVSMAISAFTLHLFYDKEGLDVIEDPPSKLIIIGIVNTMILNFIIWVILCILVPLIGGGSKKKSSSSSKKSGFLSPKRTRSSSYYRRRVYFGRRSYMITGAKYMSHPRASITHYWLVAQGLREPTVTIPRSKVEEAKQKIIDVLTEEKVVPTSNDLRRLVDMPHLLFDVALEELILEKKISFNPQAKSEWWSKGYTLTETYSQELDIKEISEEQYQEKVKEFLAKISEKQPIESRGKLWELAEEIGIRPRWKINQTIINLKNQGKIKHSRKKPTGWYAT